MISCPSFHFVESSTIRKTVRVYTIRMDGWVRVLRPFNSISVISRWWKGEHERLCAMKCRLGSGRISPPAGFEPATPWSEVGSANRGRFIYTIRSGLYTYGYVYSLNALLFRNIHSLNACLLFEYMMYRDKGALNRVISLVHTIIFPSFQADRSGQTL